MSEKFQIIDLSDKSIEKIAKAVFKLDKREKAKIKQEYSDNALHNTKKLLENYRMIKAHCEIVGYRLEEDKGTFWNDGRLDLNALLENKAKSVKYLKHVDMALLKYKDICKSKKRVGQARRYELLRGVYINKLTIESLADKYDVDRTTIIKGRDEAIEELSIILYGVETLI